MERTQKEQEISKGLDSKTVEVIRERLKRSAGQENPHYSCYYDNNIQIGWIINKPNIFIYNNFNVYFEIKLPSKIANVDATQINIINNESGTFILLWDGNAFFTRKINEEYDMLYFSVDVKSLAQDEKIVTLEMIKSSNNGIPEIAVATSIGRIVHIHAYIDDEAFSLEEQVIEAPKRFYSSLTSFFTGGNIAETNFHKIHSDTNDKDSHNTYLMWFGEKSVNIWTLSQNAPHLWRLDVDYIFKKDDHEAGDIREFKIIGEEVGISDEKDSRSLTLVVQTLSRWNEKRKELLYILFYNEVKHWSSKAYLWSQNDSTINRC